MNKHSRSSPSVAPRRGALVMLVCEDAEVLDIAGPLDILCAAGVRAPRDHRWPLLVSDHGGLVRTYPSGITLASERLRRAFLRRLGVNPRDYRNRFELTASNSQHSRSQH